MNRKIALVTGANRGIGFEISRQLGRAGVTVLMAARTIEAAENAAKRAAEEMEIDAIGVKLEGTTVKVNSAHPGLVKTDMTGDSGQISAEEGAGTAVKLALLGPDGPSGRFYYKDQELPW